MMPSAFRASTAGGKAGFLSTLMTRGTGLPGELRALRKKRLAAAASRLAVSRNSMVCPVESTAPVQIFVFTLDLYIGLVGAVAFIGGFQMGTAPFVQLRCISLHPAPDASGVNGDAAFHQKLGNVLIGQGIS